jgi:glycosyltransferase involved in cell wall biosynthesis
MQRIMSVRDIADIVLELPAGAEPYEQFDFEPYFEESRSEEELRNTWRVFTKVKDVLDNGRRTENASWRRWNKSRLQSGSSNNLAAQNLVSTPNVDEEATFQDTLRSAELATSRMSGKYFGSMGERFAKESDYVEKRAKAESVRALLALGSAHSLPPVVVDEVMAWVHGFLLTASSGQAQSENAKRALEVLPVSYEQAEEYLRTADIRPRPRAAVFCHSLERNGANNFLLYLLRELRDEISFDVFSPKEGVMRADYESMSMHVRVLDMKRPTYPQDVRRVIQPFDYAIANTIMTTEVINAAKSLNIPCLWVIHEAWPKDQFNYYAKEVFMMTHLNSAAIVEAFANASKIVFPATVQQKCYGGLFQPENARVIYNGIPLTSINSYRAVQNRHAVRKELGYGPDDLLLVHMGTVCKRKGQLVTSAAFNRAVQESEKKSGTSYKLLMVGARYIRQHEIEYIDACKKKLGESDAINRTTILDVKKNVLPYYLAADIMLCPSLNEVLPLVICEAMAFECPVIATRIDGIPESITDGVEGILIEPNDPDALYNAIAELEADPDKRARMGAAGRKRVLDQFSFATMSKAYRAAIHSDIITGI